ncbi:NADPH:quinone reductase [Gryllotalpicola ginsengisoli]|uniref:NADPH:quinone reductase n=1 Tax=Gryllotalpicola ginsengisoli TaxID=444608 RepID=UPI0003B6D83F|nr:NADPH:quinone reductase [Gryllotalpicola ginsengisoli]
MRAVVYSEKGPSSVLRVEDRPIPEPAPGEARVKLVRVGVNPTDWKARSGATSAMEFPEVVPGQDGAGVVDAVGSGVTEVAAGDQVWLYLAQHGRPYGTAAEYVVVPAARAVRLPSTVSETDAFDLGACLGVPAVTAHRALTSGEVPRLGPGTLSGSTVLVQGGAGAVGNAAIQLAVWSGATVISTVSSPEKGALATAAGAHHVVDYRASDAAAGIRALAPNGVDLIVEVAPAVNAALDHAVAANGATIAFYANNGGDRLSLEVRAAFALNLRYQGLLLYTLAPELLEAAVEDVTAAVAVGAVRVGEQSGLPLHHYPLEQTAAAHDAVEQGAVGKVLIDVA